MLGARDAACRSRAGTEGLPRAGGRGVTLPHAAPSIGAPSLKVPLLRVSSRWNCLCFHPRPDWKGRWASMLAMKLSSSAIALYLLALVVRVYSCRTRCRCWGCRH